MQPEYRKDSFGGAGRVGNCNLIPWDSDSGAELRGSVNLLVT